MQLKTEIVSIPMFVAELAKAELAVDTMDQIVSHFRSAIDAHPCARFIGLFDHHAHTRGLPDGEVAPDIIDARNIVFCFGMSLPGPEALAMRPRSIGISELADRFVITFLEPPMPLINTAMEAWTRSLLGTRASDGVAAA